MAPAPSASAFPLHPNSCRLDEHDRMLFQHSHPTGTDAEHTTLQEGVEGFSAAISKAIQPQSHALHLDQRAGTLPTHHRSNERVPGSSSLATKAAEDQPKYYKELTVRCTSLFGFGSIRRECLDHVVVLNERHLRRLLKKYLTYYHGSRTHLGLGKDAPEPRAVMSQGKIIAIPQVGGLHHRYERRAA